MYLFPWPEGGISVIRVILLAGLPRPKSSTATISGGGLY